jgi:hypothetical protein
MTSGTFVNPNVGASCDPVDLWYRCYAGYSAGFVEQTLKESAATAKLATAQQQAEHEQPALDERRQAIAAEITRLRNVRKVETVGIEPTQRSRRD